MGLDPLGGLNNNNQIRVITLIEIKAKLIQVAKLYSNILGSTIQMHLEFIGTVQCFTIKCFAAEDYSSLESS